MRLLSIVAAFFIAQNLSAYERNATQMVCEGENFSSFILYLDGETNQVRITSFFDGYTIWLADSIKVEGNQYTMQMFRPDSAGSGEMGSGKVMKRLSFSLPAKRTVSSVQTGGYYIPSYTVYPAKFNLQLNTQSESGEELARFGVECIGY